MVGSHPTTAKRWLTGWRLGVPAVAFPLVLALLLAQTDAGRRLVAIARHAGVVHLGFALKDYGEPVAITGGGPMLRGGLYRPTHAASTPAMVLVHGSTDEGRKLALYTLLANTLAERGALVLAIDLRGFGESDAPAALDDPAAWESSGDIVRAADYLRALPMVDPERVSIIAHSMGARFAFPAAKLDDRIAQIVAIGPTRRWPERVLAEDAPDRRYYYDRFFRVRRLDTRFPMATYMAFARLTNPEHHLSFFAGPDHPPIVLVDGGRERAADLAYLAAVHDRLSEPKSYVTIPDADHYLNSMSIGELVVYDRRAIDRLLDALD